MSAHSNEVLWQLFKNGPTWDGDIISKADRDWLVTNEFAERSNGWNWLSHDGVIAAIVLGYDRRKEKAKHG